MKFKKIIFAPLMAVSIVAANFGSAFAEKGNKSLNEINEISDVKVLKATSESDNSSESSSSNPAQTASQYIIVEAPPSQQDKKSDISRFSYGAEKVISKFVFSPFRTFFTGLSVAFLVCCCTHGLTGAFSFPIGFLLTLGAYFIKGYIKAPVK